jgi:hypothetical protein
MSYKKAISPVVAIALLLVVAVVAVVAFQTWFGYFQTSVFTDVEGKSTTGATMEINQLIDGVLYVKSTSDENISVSSIKVGDTICNFTATNLTKGINAIVLDDCLNNTGIKEDVVLITEDYIDSKTFYLGGESSSTSQDPQGGSNPIPTCINISEGMQALWHFDGDFSDSSGYGNDGTPQNSPGFTTGRVGQAVDLDGSSQYVNGSPFLSGSEFTFSTFFKTGDTTYAAIYWDDYTGLDDGVWIRVQPSLNQVRAALTHSLGDTVLTTSPDAFNDSQWHHLLIKFESGDSRIYVDGALIDTSTSSISSFISDNVWTIGKKNHVDGQNHFFDGQIDELTIFNRSFTEQEISDTNYLSSLNLTFCDPIPPPIINSFAANDSGPYANNNVTLSWATSNTDSCWASGNWSGDKSQSGTQEFNITQDFNTYTLTCNNSKGDEVSKTITVNISYCIKITDMEALWHFDGDFSDSSGNNNDGTNANSVTFTSGVVGNAATLNGVNQYGYSNSPIISTSDGTTFFTYFKTDGTSQGGIYWEQNSASAAGQWVRLETGGWIRSIITDDSALGRGLNTTNPPPPAYNDNQWHSLLIVFNSSSGNNRLYIDGVIGEEVYGETFGVVTSSSSWSIGRRHPNNNHYYKGQLDEMAIFNRPFTDAEINETLERVALNYTFCEP